MLLGRNHVAAALRNPESPVGSLVDQNAVTWAKEPQETNPGTKRKRLKFERLFQSGFPRYENYLCDRTANLMRTSRKDWNLRVWIRSLGGNGSQWGWLRTHGKKMMAKQQVRQPGTGRRLHRPPGSAPGGTFVATMY